MTQFLCSASCATTAPPRLQLNHVVAVADKPQPMFEPSEELDFAELFKLGHVVDISAVKQQRQ
jgi:hypothetical protein